MDHERYPAFFDWHGLECAKALGIIAFSTPFDEAAADIQTIEKRQGQRIAVPEEIAFE